MAASTSLLQFLLMLVAGWLQRQQAATIDYLKAENRMLRERLGKEQGDRELSRQRELSRTTRPQRDTARASGPKPVQPKPPTPDSDR